MAVALFLSGIMSTWFFLFIFVFPRKIFRWKEVERFSDDRFVAKKPIFKYFSFICINEVQCSSIFGIKCEEEYLYLKPRFPLSLTMKPVAIPWRQLLYMGEQKAFYPFLPKLSCFLLKNTDLTIKLRIKRTN